MAERQITFIDTDENRLIVHLKQDRVQLSVVDSEPELEGRELHGFAAALFAAYLGAPLARRLNTCHDTIEAVRAQLAARGAPALSAALDDALSGIAEVAEAMTAATSAVSPDPEPARRMYKVPRPGKARRGFRAGEGPALRWGWGHEPDEDAEPAAS